MKVAFLDRDGVINKDIGYLYEWKYFEYEQSVKYALKKLLNANYQLIVITNQSGIARGYYTEDDFHSLMSRMRKDLLESGITVLDVFYCPHHQRGTVAQYRMECECRKPNPGLFYQAFERYAIDAKKSVMFGDKNSDIEAAYSAGVGFQFLIGNSLEFETGSATFPDLGQAVDRFLNFKLL